jgi:hypothetical protein
MPGQPVRAHARFQFSPGNSPSRIASLPLGFANIHHSASRENYHVFAEPTLKQNVATRNRKTFRSCAETVDDKTCLWKPEEKPARIAPRKLSASIFQ